MATVTKDLGIATAYGYAKSKGYTGTEDEFAQAMLDITTAVDDAQQYAQDAEDAKDDAQASAESIEQSAAQIATNTSDIADLKADLDNNIESVIGYQPTPYVPISNIEQGGFDSSGLNQQSVARVRTKNYYKVNSGDSYDIKVTGTNDILFGISYYDKNDYETARIGNTSFSTDRVITVPVGAKYMRMIFGFDLAGTQTITPEDIISIEITRTESIVDQINDLNNTVSNLANYNSLLTWEVGSIYATGEDYDTSTRAIRTPKLKSIYVGSDATFRIDNANVIMIYAFKYNHVTGAFIERVGNGDKTAIQLTGGYDYRFIAIAPTGTVITTETISTYSSGIDVFGNDYVTFCNFDNNVKSVVGNIYDYTNECEWEIGSIYGSSGGNFDSNRAIRTKADKKVYIYSDSVFMSSNSNIETIYAFKYNATSGTFIERLGSANGKKVEIGGGYLYRFLIIAQVGLVITSETIDEYNENAYVQGKALADATANVYEDASYNGICIGADLIPDNIKIERVGTGALKYGQSFLIYNGKYYSTNGSNIAVQSADFAVEQDVPLAVGHGNAFVLGSSNLGYVSGWDDNRVYAVNLDTLTIDSTITLPTTGYTTCAVDDVNGLAYIFQRDSAPSTEELYKFIVYDYINDVIKATYDTTLPFGAMQGCDIYHDRILVLNGLGTNAVPNGYRVYNTRGEILAEYFFDDFSETEPEGVFIDRNTHEVYMSIASYYVYKITR